MRHTEEETQATRERIMLAALDAFAREGWQEATYEQIASAAGLTRGAVHHHFKSKTDLLQEALEFGWLAYSERLLAHLERTGSATQRLRNFIADYITLLDEDERFKALAANTVLIAPVALGPSATQSHAIDHWRSAITAALAEAEPPGPIPAELASRLIVTLLLGLTAAAVRRPADLPQPAHASTIAAGLTNALLTTSPRPST
ncbi:TetR/AcrR family transcriptional regulator [Glutamicibacter arilaitensis]|uniref:TetR/AcrR family transcriptional regulator n=1 Tax=Glutamicibacter arilaitensis TaxID=256701 RepID=UPI003FD2E815